MVLLYRYSDLSVATRIVQPLEAQLCSGFKKSRVPCGLPPITQQDRRFLIRRGSLTRDALLDAPSRRCQRCDLWGIRLRLCQREWTLLGRRLHRWSSDLWWCSNLACLLLGQRDSLLGL